MLRPRRRGFPDQRTAAGSEEPPQIRERDVSVTAPASAKVPVAPHRTRHRERDADSRLPKPSIG